jgi:hypothetical protein
MLKRVFDWLRSIWRSRRAFHYRDDGRALKSLPGKVAGYYLLIHPFDWPLERSRVLSVKNF